MRDYKQLEVLDGEILEAGDLFYPCEKTRAETILTALDGVDIISAQALLDKCKEALLQAPFTA